MMYSSQAQEQIRRRFERLYGDRAIQCLSRFDMLVGRYGIEPAAQPSPEKWDQTDALLITYADMVRAGGEKPLVTLKRFLDSHLRGAISTVHLLPFFPYSSDDGFSVIHYRQVDPAVGDWKAVGAVGEHFKLMMDLVLNHVSRKSGWFIDFTTGTAPGRDFFIVPPTVTDLSAVVRPRTTPLLTPVQTRKGLQHVWTTFSADQIDLNFANPDVLFEILDILLFYIHAGARVIRLDAIAYLWKKIGTSCIHLPETHEVVKLFRNFLSIVAPDVILLTETNVPHNENIGYFGDGDEAHLVYQFALPPLILHALVNGHARHLARWAAGLRPPPSGCTFLNFTASHDGIGVRPLEGLVPAGEVKALAGHVEKCGGLVSCKTDPGGTESPYELNVSWIDAMRDRDGQSDPLHNRRILCSQAIAMALKGIPALYFNTLAAAPNDIDGVKRTGLKRSINRHKWEEIELLLSTKRETFSALVDMLKIRAAHSAFHPDADQRVLNADDRLLVVERHNAKTGKTVIAACNVSDQVIPFKPGRTDLQPFLGHPTERDPGNMELPPYEVVWLGSL